MDGFDVDIYIPYWSKLGLPPEFILNNTLIIDGFRIPRKEILLILKLFAYNQRKGSLKGKKDAIDIIILLYKDTPDLKQIRNLAQEHHLEKLIDELKNLLNSLIKVDEIGINNKQYADFKKKILKEI